MRLSRDHITTLRQTRLAIPRATRFTAIPIPRCKLPGQPRRVARHLPAHTSAAATDGASAATAAETTATKRHVRGIAAEEPEEDEVLAVPAQAGQHDARHRCALDAGVASRLVRPSRRLQAGIHHLKRHTAPAQQAPGPRGPGDPRSSMPTLSQQTNTTNAFAASRIPATRPLSRSIPRRPTVRRGNKRSKNRISSSSPPSSKFLRARAADRPRTSAELERRILPGARPSSSEEPRGARENRFEAESSRVTGGPARDPRLGDQRSGGHLFRTLGRGPR